MIARGFILIVALPVLVLTFVSTLLVETRSAFWRAWNDTMIDLGSMKAAWRAKSLKREDQ